MAAKALRMQNNDAVIGDLDERYRAGRSAAWYWQQAFIAICSSTANEIRVHKLLALRAVVIGWASLLVCMLTIPVLFNASRAAISGLLGSRLLWGSSGLGDLNRYFDIQEKLRAWTLALPAFVLLTYAAFASAGWSVARLHRPHAKAMVLAFATSSVVVTLAMYKHTDNLVFGILSFISILAGGGFFNPHSDETPKAL